MWSFEISERQVRWKWYQFGDVAILRKRGEQPFGSHGFLSQMFERFIFQMQVLKVGVPEAGDNPSFLGRSSGSVRSLGIAGCHAGVGFMARLCLSLSYLLWCVCWREGVTQLIFTSFSEWTALRKEWGGGEFKLFLCHHVELLFRAYI